MCILSVLNFSIDAIPLILTCKLFLLCIGVSIQRVTNVDNMLFPPNLTDLGSSWPHTGFSLAKNFLLYFRVLSKHCKIYLGIQIEIFCPWRDSLPNSLPETQENHGSFYKDHDGSPGVSALCCVDLRLSAHYILSLLSTYLKTRLSHWSLVLLQPVKDDPHFHHFLLSQSEKVRGSMLLSAP